jgi:pimeloyl-ACP methyl ester carboxylesterase
LQWEWLASQGIAACTFDLAGHGDSDLVPSHRPTDHAKDLMQLLDQLDFQQPPLLVCHSYGVTVGIEYAAHQKVQGLLGLGGGIFGLTPWWEKPLVYLLEKGGRFLLHKRHKLPSKPEPYIAMRGFWNYDGRAKASAIEAPVVLMTGMSDLVFTPTMAKQQAQYFPNGQAVTVPSSGHNLMTDQPEMLYGWIDLLRTSENH